MAWYRGEQAAGGDVVLARLTPSNALPFDVVVQGAKVLGRFAPDEGVTRPDLASDAQRTIVVWRTTSAAGDHDIVGSSIDRAGNVAHFGIAASAADERDPSVISLANGSFLVAYETVSGGERRLAARFLTFAGRRRAVR